MQHQEAGRGVLDGAFALLDAIPDTARPHQVRDLAQVVGIPRPSVYRLLAQLQQLGMVELVAGRYILGRDLLRVARRVEPAAGLRRAAAPVMQALREQTGATVSLITHGAVSPLILDTVPGRDALPVEIFQGRLLPHDAAGALVLDPRAAPGRVDPVRRIAVDRGDVIGGLSCVAAALTLPDGTTAALQLSTTPATPALHYSAATQHAAARIRDTVRTAPATA